MASNPIPKVNDDNEIIGETTITEAFKNNWPRRVTRIIITNEKGAYLMQKRCLDSKIHPGVWDCSGGHVDVGETYEEAGVREVLEELGVTVKVTKVSEPVFYKNTFYQTCVAKLSSESVFTLQEDEVAEVKWVTSGELIQLLKHHPESFTPWVVHIWENFENELTDAL